jgi:uncharacterized phage-like protein YoqJ
MRTEKNEQQTHGRSAAFSGHRHISPDRVPTLIRNLDATIARLYEEGVTTFHCGMAMGFDLMAAESVLNLRAFHPEVKLIAVIPFKGQDKFYIDEDKARYAKVLASADNKVIMSKSYSKSSYLRRNIYMLKNASVLVAYLDPTQKYGGTAYTCSHAHEYSVYLINLY